MFFFACPACSCRISVCHGGNIVLTSRCPSCNILIAFVREQRTLLDKIKDSWTPTDLLLSIKEA